MKIYERRLLSAHALFACCCLFVVATPCAGGASDDAAASADEAASEPAAEAPQSDDKHEDVVDRLFAPLDDAVSDINRDINKGEDGSSSDSSP